MPCTNIENELKNQNENKKVDKMRSLAMMNAFFMKPSHETGIVHAHF